MIERRASGWIHTQRALYRMLQCQKASWNLDPPVLAQRMIVPDVRIGLWMERGLADAVQPVPSATYHADIGLRISGPTSSD